MWHPRLSAPAQARPTRGTRWCDALRGPDGPVLDYVQASEWTASTNPYPITERTEILWTRLPQLSERAFALVVEGESMIGEFYPGDIVIVDPEVAPRPGDYVVAKMAAEDAVMFRKYRPRGKIKGVSPWSS